MGTKKIPRAKPDEFKVNPEWYRLMPPITGEDEKALKEDILSNGIRDPLDVAEDMTIIDGHQRHRIVYQNKEIDRNIPYNIRSDLKLEDVPEHIIRTNFLRRQLSTMRKAQIAVDTAIGWGWFDEAKKQQGTRTDLLPEVDKKLTPIDTRDRIAKTFKVNKEAVWLYMKVKREKDWKLMKKLLDGTTSISDATKVLARKDKIREDRMNAPQKFVLPMHDKKIFDVHFTRLRDIIWSPSQGERAIITVKYEKAKVTKPVIDKSRSWKPTEFKETACIHGVVGGCHQCYGDSDEAKHSKQGVVIKQDSIVLPMGKEEMSGFRILPDRGMEPCRNCEEFFDPINVVCTINLEEDTVPKNCRKFTK